MTNAWVGRSFGFAIVMLCWVGCGEDEGDEGDSDLQPCPQIPTTALDGMPVTLRASGLYREGSEALAEGVREFRPQFELWTDGATKRRFIALPAGTSIDTSDPDAWVFPPGTRVWKEFVRDGVRVETRLLRKVDAATWQPVTYVWREDQTDADPFLDGIEDARSTAHDVPAVADCAACHAGAEDFVLGFSAVQLAHPDAGLDLDTASALGWLSDPMMNDAVQVPGDADTRAALGRRWRRCQRHRGPSLGGRSGRSLGATTRTSSSSEISAAWIASSSGSAFAELPQSTTIEFPFGHAMWMQSPCPALRKSITSGSGATPASGATVSVSGQGGAGGAGAGWGLGSAVTRVGSGG